MNLVTVTKPFELWLARDCLARHGCRPVIIVSIEEDAEYVTVVPLTSNRESTQFPSHVLIAEQGLDHISRALCEQVRTIGKETLMRRIGYVYQPFDRFAIRHALAIHLGLCTEEENTAWS